MSLQFYFAELIEKQGAKDCVIVRDDAASSHRTHFSLSRRRKDSKFDSFSKLSSHAPSCPLRKESSDDLCDNLRRSLHSKRRSSPKAVDSLYLNIVKKHGSARGEDHRSSKHKAAKLDAASNAQTNVKLIRDILSSVTDMLEEEEVRRLNHEEQDECA